jgi:hypothetical protein
MAGEDETPEEIHSIVPLSGTDQRILGETPKAVKPLPRGL